MNDVFVVDILRTPIGKFGGTLANERPDDLAAHVIKALINRNQQVDWNAIDEVILGAANQAGEDNRNVARMSLLLAGLPEHIPGYTVNRLCASGLQSMQNAFMAIRSGQADAIIAGGTESMTRAPFVMAKSEKAYSRVPEIYDTTIGWRFTNSKLSELHHPYSMGETAENVAEKYNIDLVDYSPREIKQSIVGNGSASEEQVAFMVKKIFKLKDEALKSTDVSDAIAVAWCGANRKIK